MQSAFLEQVQAEHFEAYLLSDGEEVGTQLKLQVLD